jgi:hypothetical protein
MEKHDIHVRVIEGQWGVEVNRPSAVSSGEKGVTVKMQ